MSRFQTFTLREASLSLYAAAADGSPLSDEPLFLGACEEGLELPVGYDTIVLRPTGALYPERYHARRPLQVLVRRLWVMAAGDLEDFSPGFNQRYVLDIVWQDPRKNLWHRRAYYGVTADEWNLSSNGIMQFAGEQIFHAQRYVSSSGTGTYAPATPTADAGELQLPFFQPGVVVADDYFLGHYSLRAAHTFTAARAIAQAGAGTDTVLALEVSGVLTGDTLTLPAGSGEVAVSAVLDQTISPGQLIRWKCASGPGLAEAAAIVMS